MSQSEIDPELARRANEQVRQLLEMLFSSGCKIVYTQTIDEPEEVKSEPTV